MDKNIFCSLFETYSSLVSLLSVPLFVKSILPRDLSSCCYQRQSTSIYPLFVQTF